MILFTIGSDRNLFKKNSDVWNRYLDYGKLFEEIHVIIFSSRWLGNEKTRIGDNVFVYPTNHIFKFFYLWNIYGIVKKITNYELRIRDKNSKNEIRNPQSAIRNYRNNLIVSAQDPFEAGLAGWMVKKVFKISLQIQIHTDFLSPYFWQESLMNKARVLLAKFLIPRSDGIRVVSERIKNSLVANGYSLIPITVLPIFVDIEAIKSASIKEDLHKKYPQFDFIILMASRLSREKNIELAIKALAELTKKYPKLGLVICGKGPEENNIKSLILNLKLDSNVVFEGWSGDLISYYKSADLYLLTSNYEGYGRSVVEAMAAGLPVVMTDVGLAGEIVKNGENGAVFAIGNKKDMVKQIELLLSSEEKRRSLSGGARHVVKNLITKQNYLNLYRDLLDKLLV